MHYDNIYILAKISGTINTQIAPKFNIVGKTVKGFHLFRLQF